MRCMMQADDGELDDGKDAGQAGYSEDQADYDKVQDKNTGNEDDALRESQDQVYHTAHHQQACVCLCRSCCPAVC